MTSVNVLLIVNRQYGSIKEKYEISKSGSSKIGISELLIKWLNNKDTKKNKVKKHDVDMQYWLKLWNLSDIYKTIIIIINNIHLLPVEVSDKNGFLLKNIQFCVSQNI